MGSQGSVDFLKLSGVPESSRSKACNRIANKSSRDIVQGINWLSAAASSGCRALIALEDNTKTVIENHLSDGEEERSPYHPVDEHDKFVGRMTWTKEEDDVLLRLVQRYGPKKWVRISLHFKDRNAKQCHQRWNYCLNSKIRKGGWTGFEDRMIVKYQKLYGNQWSRIAKLVPGRTGHAIRNRYHCILKREKTSCKMRGQKLVGKKDPAVLGSTTAMMETEIFIEPTMQQQSFNKKREEDPMSSHQLLFTRISRRPATSSECAVQSFERGQMPGKASNLFVMSSATTAARGLLKLGSRDREDRLADPTSILSLSQPSDNKTNYSAHRPPIQDYGMAGDARAYEGNCSPNWKSFETVDKTAFSTNTEHEGEKFPSFHSACYPPAACNSSPPPFFYVYLGKDPYCYKTRASTMPSAAGSMGSGKKTGNATLERLTARLLETISTGRT